RWSRILAGLVPCCAAKVLSNASLRAAVDPTVAIRNELRKRVDGSRLRALQMSSISRIADLSVSVRAEVPRLKLNALAYRAAARMTRGFDSPIQNGSGFCVVFGGERASWISMCTS